VHRLVTLARAVATSVWDVLKDHRCRCGPSRPRQKQSSRKPAPVMKRNPNGLDFVDQIKDISVLGDAKR
jgi:hypothetical protein